MPRIIMDLCVGLLGFLVVAAIIMAVGHGGWVLVAALFTAVSGHKPARKGNTHCPACGTVVRDGDLRCEICRLDQESRLARYLRDADAADHILALLQRDDYLDAATGGKVRRVLAERRQAALSPEVLKPWLVVENLLSEERSTADLAPSQLRGLLFFFDQMTSEEWNRLSSGDLFRMGRLLEQRDAKWKALDVYEQLVATQTISTARLPAALRGASLSLALSDRARGKKFLEHARRWAQTAEEQQRLAALEQQFGTPAVAEVPEIVEIHEAVPEAPLVEPAPATFAFAEPVPVTPPPAPVRRVLRERVERGTPPPPPRKVREEPPEPPKPRRSFGEMLAGFMEEKNILWGELAGGLLIVGCSIALVISLWQTLEKIPYFPFLILTAITAAIFGAGLYTLRHWKLESTSRSLLLIATLLTPLDFLVLAGLQKGEGGALSLALEVGALMALGWLTWKAGRILATPLLDAKAGRPDYAAAITLAAASASILLTPRWLPIAEPVAWRFVLLSMLPAIVHACSAGWIIESLGSRDVVDRSRAASLLLYLGETTFAITMGLGFLVYWGGDPTRVFSRLAVPIAVVAWPMTLAGAMLRRRLADDATSALVRVLSSACGFLGLALVALSLGLAWPRPTAMVIVGTANAAALAVIAWRWRHSWLLALALPAFALAFVVSSLAATGQVAWEHESSNHLAAMLTGPASSLCWMALMALWLGAAELASRFGRGVAARFLWAGALLASLAGMGSIARDSLGIPGQAAMVFASSAAAGMFVALRYRHVATAWPALAALFGTLFFAVRFFAPHLHLDETLLLSLLAYIGCVGLPGLIASKRLSPESRWAPMAKPMLAMGLTASLVAVIPWATTLHWDALWLSSGAMLALAAWWGAWSRAEETPIGFALCQLGSGAAACIAAAAWMHGLGELQVWADLWHARSLQGMLLALSLWALGWSVVRARLSGRAGWQTLFDPELPALDRVALGLLVFVQFFVIVSGVLPELGREIGIVPARIVGPNVDLMRGFAVVVILAGAMTWRMLGGRPMTGYLGLHFLAWTLPWLFAAPHRGDVATASALRWWLGLLFPTALSLTWARQPLLRRLQGWSRNGEGEIATAGRFAQWMALTLGLGLVIVLTLATAERGFAEMPLGGPIPGSLFARMGVMANMVGPLALLAIGLLGTGVFEAKPGALFSAILLTTATLVGGTALGMVQAQIPIREAQLIRLAQIGMGAAAGCTILWLAIGKWRSPSYLTASIALARFISLPLLLATLFAVFLPVSFAPTLADSAAWIALAAVTLATIGVQRLIGRRSIVSVVCFDALTAMLAIVGLARFRGWAVEPNLLLVLEFSLFSLGLIALSWITNAGRSTAGEHEGFLDKAASLFPPGETQTWTLAFGAAMLLSLFGMELGHEHRSSIALGFALLTALIGLLAIWRHSAFLVYVSGLLPTLMVALEWINDPWRRPAAFRGLDPADHEAWSWLFAVALAGASIVWGLIASRLQARQQTAERSRFPSAHFAAFAVGLATATLVLSALIATVCSAAGSGWAFQGAPALWMWGVVTLAIFRSLFFGDEDERNTAPAMLYSIGLVWTAGLARWIGFDAASILQSLPWMLAGFALLAAVASRLLSKQRTISEDASWFVAMQFVVLGVSLALGLRLVLVEGDHAARWLGPVAGMLSAATLGLMAHANRQREARGQSLAVVTLLACWFTACMATWAMMGPDVPALWLHRSVAMLAVSLTSVLAFSGRGLGRVAIPLWKEAAKRLAPSMACMSGGLLLLILGQEFALYDRVARRTPMLWPAVLLVLALLLALVGGLLVAALRPRNNEQSWSERTRKGLVWAAEIAFALAFVHLRLNVPDIFPGYLGNKWPLILMGIGFAATAAGELFARRGNMVLADPLRKTGFSLPMVPILAFVLKPAILAMHLEQALPGFEPLLRYLHVLPDSPALHASLWFLLGALYLMVAGMRRSPNHLLLAALWANFGLWVVLAHQEGLGLFVHPQLWLIPVGVLLLAAEMVNRPRLSHDQRQMIRWLALSLIYASSAADLFIAGLGEWPLAVLLAVLSVAGIFLGIFLRVRAILFMGIAFLSIDVFAQIWHAAVDHRQTWIWWTCGILLGIAILVLFALFEKRRNDIERMLANLKQWE
jgi:hypothetical protein